MSSIFDPFRRWNVGASLIPHYVNGGALLDVGCGAGEALAFFHSLGWTDLHGIELVPEAAARAEKTGASIICAPVEQALGSYADESFDVIHSTMVLEHLVDPFSVCRIIAKKLKPGGQFLFSTVVRGSMDERIFGKYWAGFDFPRHMVLFRKKDLESMLGDSFFNIEFFAQSAPADYLRSASWRGSVPDRILLAVSRKILPSLTLVLALLGSGTRVSVRCRRKVKEGSVSVRLT